MLNVSRHIMNPLNLYKDCRTKLAECAFLDLAWLTVSEAKERDTRKEFCSYIHIYIYHVDIRVCSGRCMNITTKGK